MKDKIKSVLHNVQRRVNTPKDYNEVQSYNDVVELVTEFNKTRPQFHTLEGKILRELERLMYSLQNIAARHQTAHWNSVISSQIGWFLTWLDTYNEYVED